MSAIPVGRSGRPGVSLQAPLVFAALGFLLATSGGFGRARAEDATDAEASADAACVSSYTDAQRLRKAGKLLAARTELVRCSQASCPAVVQQDCVPWLAQVEAATPTLVIAAKGRDGRDTAEVRLLVDGVVVADRLTGRSIALDPGPHQLRFEHPNAPAIERSVLVQEAAKDRRIDVSFAPEPPAQPPVPAVGPRAAPQGGAGEAEPRDPSIAIAGYVLTGVGVLGLGAFAVLGLVGKGEADDYDQSCGPTRTCNEDDVAATQNKLIGADVSLAVGITALAVGVSLILWDALGNDDVSASAARLEVRPALGGAIGAVRWTF